VQFRLVMSGPGVEQLESFWDLFAFWAAGMLFAF